jgi:hypothetical protein
MMITIIIVLCWSGGDAASCVARGRVAAGTKAVKPSGRDIIPKMKRGRNEQSDGTRKENSDGNLKGKCDHFPTNVL